MSEARVQAQPVPTVSAARFQDIQEVPGVFRFVRIFPDQLLVLRQAEGVLQQTGDRGVHVPAFGLRLLDLRQVFPTSSFSADQAVLSFHAADIGDRDLDVPDLRPVQDARQDRVFDPCVLQLRPDQDGVRGGPLDDPFP